ncbi:hypothetical protein ACC731_38580, partial [Rhizobium ruizarguesonis]
RSKKRPVSSMMRKTTASVSGTASATTSAVKKVEDWLQTQPATNIVTSYVGQGAPRFFFAMALITGQLSAVAATITS